MDMLIIIKVDTDNCQTLGMRINIESEEKIQQYVFKNIQIERYKNKS